MTELEKWNRKASVKLEREPETLTVWKLNTMGEAARHWDLAHVLLPEDFRPKYRREVLQPMRDRAINCDRLRLNRALDTSNALIAAAIAYDNRLARKAGWAWAAEGIEASPDALACNSERPFLARRRQDITANAAHGQPVVIVVSTDSNAVELDTAVAFIATVRIVQQFRPVHVWWQGAFLDNSDAYSYRPKRGFVFLVPLVQGGIDFARLDFVISDQQRDTLAWSVMAHKAVMELKVCPTTCMGPAEQCFLPEANDFVKNTGIEPTGQDIARTAARWLRWKSVYDLRYETRNAARAALQHWYPPEEPQTVPAASLTPGQAAKLRHEAEAAQRRYDRSRKQAEEDHRRKAKEAAKARQDLLRPK